MFVGKKKGAGGKGKTNSLSPFKPLKKRKEALGAHKNLGDTFAGIPLWARGKGRGIKKNSSFREERREKECAFGKEVHSLGANEARTKRAST